MKQADGTGRIPAQDTQPANRPPPGLSRDFGTFQAGEPVLGGEIAPTARGVRCWRGKAIALGSPEGMGSKRIGRHGDRAVVIDVGAAGLRDWQRQIAQSGQRTAPTALVTGAVGMSLMVTVLRPSSHYGTGKNAGQLKASAPTRPASGRDLDKVARAVGDALTGVFYRNDAQIAFWIIERRYCEREPRTELECWELI